MKVLVKELAVDL